MTEPRILVVDDDPYQLAVLEKMLMEGGYRVRPCSTTAEALARVEEEDYDLALLDIVIDELDGFELCRRIKENPRSRDLPVIFLTGERGSLKNRLKGFSVGALDYLLKPVSQEELVARVRVMLALRRTQQELKALADSLQEKVEERTARLQEALVELQEQKALSEGIVKSAPAALLVVDGNGRVVTCNRIFATLFGDLSRGTPLSAVERLESLALAEEASGPAHEFRLALHTLAGDVRTFAVGLSTMEAGPDCPEDTKIYSLTDITEKELAAAALRGRSPAEICRELELLKQEATGRYRMDGMVGMAPTMVAVTEQVEKLRQGRATVLIQGESGTGKELVARALHYDGPSAARPFVPLHCGAISRDLIESELFGHERGAFTGAIKAKEGLFKAADGGTIFLDEVGEISPATQIKLLRVLQEGTFMPVGSNQTHRVDVRIIAATNKDLAREVGEGHFREDLYYRLAVVQIDMPPLRERQGDVPLLVAHFINKYNAIYGRRRNPVQDVSLAVRRVLLDHDWPGNVRELENVLVRAFELGCGQVIHARDLPPYLERRAAERAKELPEYGEEELQVEIPRRKFSLEDFEKAALLEALKRTKGDKLQAAQDLGIGKSTFYRKLKKFNIT